MFEGLTAGLCYFAPTIIAWYRKSQGKPITFTLPQIFLFNLLLAWTVVGWFLALSSAFGKNPVAWIVTRVVGKSTGGPGFVPPRPVGATAATGVQMICSGCGGAGSIRCSTCQGRGSWYNPPTTANGVAQLQTCGACMSSGNLRCTICGGSGRVPGPIG